MKKVLSAILALVICLSICACEYDNSCNCGCSYCCDGENSTNIETEEIKKYGVDETAISSLFECSLSEVSFTKKVEADEHSPGYMLPATEDTKITQHPMSSGNIFLCFSVKLKYIGTTTIHDMSFGNSKGGIGFYATYDNAYEYTTFVASRNKDFGWEKKKTYDGQSTVDLSFTPLSNQTLSVRACIELPSIVENADKPLDITVYLGNNESVTFSINP